MKSKTTPDKRHHNDDKLDESLVHKAVAALLQHHSKTTADDASKALLGTDCWVQVQIGLEVAPIKPSPKPQRIDIPHALYQLSGNDEDEGLEEPEVCLIVKDESKPWVQELIAQFPEMNMVKKVLTLSSLRKKYAQFQQRRELLHRYSVFMADDRILPMLTKALGRDFYKAKKLPIPLALTRKEALPFAIQRALRATFLTLSEGTCVTIRAGSTAMTERQLVANLLAIIPGAITKSIPRKWANVRTVAIKTPTSVALPLYNKTPEELQEIAKLAGLAPVWKQASAAEDHNDDNDGEEEESKKRLRERQAKSPLVRALKKVKEQDQQTSKKDESGRKEDKPKKASATSDSADKISKKRKKSDSEVSKEETVYKDRNETAQNDDKQKPKKKKTKKAKTSEPTNANEGDASDSVSAKKKKTKTNADFIAARKFTSLKQGYAFYKGPQGLGYYKDVPPVPDKAAMAALARMAKQSSGGKKGKRSAASGKRRGRR